MVSIMVEQYVLIEHTTICLTKVGKTEEVGNKYYGMYTY